MTLDIIDISNEKFTENCMVCGLELVPTTMCLRCVSVVNTAIGTRYMQKWIAGISRGDQDETF